MYNLNKIHNFHKYIMGWGNMKKLIMVMTLMLTLIVTGCSKEEDFQIEYQDLTKEQFELLTLTGNRVFKYNLKNLPNDKKYRLELVYEVYKNNKKVKEESFFGIGYEPMDETLEDSTLAINVQDKKITSFLSGASSYIDIDEDISKLSQYQSFSGNTEIKLGDEIYLFQGTKGEYNLINISSGRLSKEEKNKIIKGNELNIFIKLVCKG